MYQKFKLINKNTRIHNGKFEQFKTILISVKFEEI